MVKLTKEQIEVAVEWWKRILKNPKFDMGADSRETRWAEAMATVQHHSPDEDFLERFAQSLRVRLEGLEGPTLDYHAFYLGADYHPCKILHEAYCEAGGGDSGMPTFPWKTGMWFRDGGVQVCYGYGAPIEELLKGE